MNRLIDDLGIGEQVIRNIQYIADEDVEQYFVAADVLVLPYKFIYQSGVLFLAYSFGLPVIAFDVGTLREDIVPGKTGFLCCPEDSDALAAAINTYFDSDLFRNLEIIASRSLNSQTSTIRGKRSVKSRTRSTRV